jgi:hypothetical protein
MKSADTRPVSVWVAPFVWLLILTLVLLGWVQWRQYQLLYDTSNRQVDRLMWQAAELMRERDRLSHARGTRLVMGNALVGHLLYALSKQGTATLALMPPILSVGRYPDESGMLYTALFL